MPSIGALSDVPLISLEPMGFGEEDCRGQMPFSSPLIKGMYYQCDLHLNIDRDQLAEAVFLASPL